MSFASIVRFTVATAAASTLAILAVAPVASAGVVSTDSVRITSTTN
ncbi:hypothetical protein [Umezawaea beigongshangensis]|nr:hypothetical protein [Umezawaea beigongshangensis]